MKTYHFFNCLFLFFMMIDEPVKAQIKAILPVIKPVKPVIKTKPAVKPPPTPAPRTDTRAQTVNFYSDDECLLYLDGKVEGYMHVSEIRKVPLRKGNHLLRIVSIRYNKVSLYKEFSITETGGEQDYPIVIRQLVTDSLKKDNQKEEDPLPVLKTAGQSVAQKTRYFTSYEFWYMIDTAIKAKNTILADSVITAYKILYPNEVTPYQMAVMNAQMKDTSGDAAVVPITDCIAFLMHGNLAENAVNIAYYHALLGSYYNNTVKDPEKALYELEQAVKYDPKEAQYQKYVDLLRQAIHHK